jgi:hypothetical protein
LRLSSVRVFKIYSHEFYLSCQIIITFIHLIHISILDIVDFVTVAHSLSIPIIRQEEGRYLTERHSRYGNMHINSTSILVISKNHRFFHIRSKAHPWDHQIINSTWLLAHWYSAFHTWFGWKLLDNMGICLKIYCFKGCKYSKIYVCRLVFQFFFIQYLWDQWGRWSTKLYFSPFFTV